VDRFSVVGDLLLPPGDTMHPAIILVWGSGQAGRHRIEKPSEIITTFLKGGYAVFIEDKPGSGASTGKFSEDHLLSERAIILAKEVDLLKNRPEICSHQVGVYGTSQAGYVMALAMRSETKYNFMVAVSCPAAASIEQSAYLIKRQLGCEGYPPGTARQAEEYFIQRERARDYQTYLEAAKYLDGFPIVRDDLGWGGIKREDQFLPPGDDADKYFNPKDEYEKMTIPLLAVFGEKDTQIDPIQGRDAFQNAPMKNGNPFFRVEMLADTDHNMRISITGCIKEQIENNRNEVAPGYNPEFLKLLSEWLVELKQKMETSENESRPKLSCS
jgi:pimeloyl-ACP methyl ester carboxylesterase